MSAIKPLRARYSNYLQDLLRICGHKINLESTLGKYPQKESCGTAIRNTKKMMTFGMVLTVFKWLEKTYKMHVRVFLSKYRGYFECPECKGSRFKRETNFGDGMVFRLQTYTLYYRIYLICSNIQSPKIQK